MGRSSPTRQLWPWPSTSREPSISVDQPQRVHGHAPLLSPARAEDECRSHRDCLSNGIENLRDRKAGHLDGASRGNGLKVFSDVYSVV